MWIDRDDAAVLARVLNAVRARAVFTGTGTTDPRIQRLHQRIAVAAIGHDVDVKPHLDDMVNVSEAARILGYSERTIRRRAHDFGGQQIGRTWLFHRSDLTTLGGHDQ